MKFICNECGRLIQVQDDLMGKKVACGSCAAQIEVPTSRLSPASVINDFIIALPVLVRPDATLYLAHQISLNQPVWLKILRNELAEDSDSVIAFVKEIRERAADYSFQPRPRSVGEDEGLYFQAYECQDEDDTGAMEAVFGE